MTFKTRGRLLAGAVLALALTATTARAQDAGERVRVSTGSERFGGMLVELQADSLVLSDNGARRAVPLSDVRRLEVRRERTRGQAALSNGVKGLLGGAVLGALVGVAANAADDECDADDDCWDIISGEEVVGILTVFGASVGAGGGIVLGLVNPGTRWERADAPRITVAPRQDGGVAVGASLSF